MSTKVKIQKIIVRSGEFEIEAKVKSEKIGQSRMLDKKYYLSFNPKKGWSPYEAVHKIASYMSIRTGKERKVPGRLLRDKMLGVTEEEFRKWIYYLWSSSKYEYRIGQAGIFKLYALVRGKSELEKNKKLRIAIAQAFFQKEGKKSSKGSHYWLGDYRTTKIEFDPEYGYEPAFKDEHVFPEYYLYLGISLAKLAEQSNNEEYFVKAIEYFKLVAGHYQKNAQAYINWGASLIGLAQLRKSRKLYLRSLQKSSLAMKYDKGIYQPYLNRGIALGHLAELSHNHQLYDKAISNLKKSVEIKRENPHAYSHWALFLQRLGEVNEDTGLLRDACKMYRVALEYDERHFGLYMNLANALSRLGEKTKEETYFRKAINNYELAVKYNDRYPQIYLNWGACLFRYSTLVSKNDLINQSAELLMNAYSLSILQKNWDYAIYIYFFYLLYVGERCENEYYVVLARVFLEAIQVIQTEKRIESDRIRELKELRGKGEEADLVIDAMLDSGTEENAFKKRPDNLVTKAAMVLEEELRLKRGR